MAKTTRKKKVAKKTTKKTAKKTARKKPAKKKAKRKSSSTITASANVKSSSKVSVVPNRRAEDLEATELEMKGGRLVVQISRDEHPEIFAINKLLKQTQKVIAEYQRKKKMRDLVEFLIETEKSLQIVLKNHLEDAMRTYLS